jgi:enamine deaminase RidA (YjgF/YER057c/UK114 family)
LARVVAASIGRAAIRSPARRNRFSKGPHRMTHELINPEELPTPQSYTHVITATGGRMVFIAGQVADDAQGNIVGPGDLAAQAGQAFANVGRCLAAAGAVPQQVTKITIYVVGHRPEYLPAISAARIAVFGDHKPTDTLVGVETLAEPGYLIEVDAIAVVD